MVKCRYIKEDSGIQCNFTGARHDWFYFHDSHDLFAERVNICHEHSQIIFTPLTASEESIKHTLTQLTMEYRTLSRKDQPIEGRKVFNQDYNRMELILNDGSRLPVESYRDLTSPKRQVERDEKKKKNWEERSRLRSLLNIIRNKTCRFCSHTLDCKCRNCQQRQWSEIYTTCDLKSYRGLRRVDVLFHTLCGRIWLQAKFGIRMLPTKQDQQTIDQVITVESS